jgi:hypothetical protein
MQYDPTAVYAPSATVAARTIEDEFIIVSLEQGQNGSAEELYFLNETGRVVWELLDGHKSLEHVVHEISQRYNTNSIEEIRQDVCHLINELVDHKIITVIDKRS